MTSVVIYENLCIRVSGLVHGSTGPYNELSGAFGHCKPHFVSLQNKSDKGIEFFIELPTVTPVSKGIWKK